MDDKAKDNQRESGLNNIIFRLLECAELSAQLFYCGSKPGTRPVLSDLYTSLQMDLFIPFDVQLEQARSRDDCARRVVLEMLKAFTSLAPRKFTYVHSLF
ncbi:hypothetical protein RRG08_064863 [Elysia crispata]|uniref:Uncharacterized protein n=1 Tax=Elysia crispata TaxID=231223 RepID=A0AAE1AXZ1_9GAST|nr:hypothetical protein RRG08_064863 [Elysia crispata]